MDVRVRTILAGVVLLLTVSGCVTNGGSAGGSTAATQPKGLVPKRASPIPDIPVPIGFELDEGRSQSSDSGRGVRWVRHVYLGLADKFAVSRFYKQHMPEHGWVRQMDRMNQGTILLSFRNADTNEICEVVISDTRSWMLPKTSIRVELVPAGQGEMPAEQQ